MLAPRILLDNNVPVHLIHLLRPRDVLHAYDLGWGAISNGDLIRVAREAAFTLIVTCDQNIRYQQASGLAAIILRRHQHDALAHNPGQPRDCHSGH